MDAALHDHDGLAFELANHQTANVAWRSGTRPMGQVSKGNKSGILNGLGHAAQAGAKN